MQVGEVPAEWVDWVADHELVCTGHKDDDGLSNMLMFPLSETTLTSELLKRFLMDVFHAFCVKAARLHFLGWFYAWYDEQAGQLRCSACQVETAAELPFGCTLEIVNVPDKVALTAVTSARNQSVPWSELVEVEVSVRDDDEDLFQHTLTVFAKPMG